MTDLASRLARIETHTSVIQADQAEVKSNQAELRVYLTRVLEGQEARLRAVELGHASALPRIDIISVEMDTLRKRVYAWDMVNSLAAFVAGLIGVRR